MKKIRIIGYAFALGAFALASPAFAQISSSSDAVGLTGSLRAGVTDTGASTTVRASTSGGATYNTLNGGVSTNGASSSNQFVITRSDVTATTSTISASSVSSESDFAAYARGVLMTDLNVSKISSSDTEVSVWYREPAKFLGVVPVTATVKATVDASGTVSVDYPWWYGLFVKDDTQAQFQSDLSNTAGTIARGEASTAFSSAAKARLTNALQSIMKARYDATVGTSTAETTAY